MARYDDVRTEICTEFGSYLERSLFFILDTRDWCGLLSLWISMCVRGCVHECACFSRVLKDTGIERPNIYCKASRHRMTSLVLRRESYYHLKLFWS